MKRKKNQNVRREWLAVGVPWVMLIAIMGRAQEPPTGQKQASHPSRHDQVTFQKNKKIIFDYGPAATLEEFTISFNKKNKNTADLTWIRNIRVFP